MPVLTVVNVSLSGTQVSDVTGRTMFVLSVAAGQTEVASVDSDLLERLSGQLEYLRNAGIIEYGVSNDAGVPDPLEIAQVPARTEHALTLYVDAALGDDTNPGTAANPLKTISAALERVPRIIEHNVVISLSAGTYTESIRIYGTLPVGVTITITCPDEITPTLDGQTSGTFTSAGDTTATVSGAAWTAGELTGKFLKMSDGQHAGKWLPILDNTADTIEIARTGSTVNGDSFTIVEPAATVGDASAADPIQSLCSGVDVRTVVVLSHLNIAGGSFSAVRAASASAIELDGCNVDGNGPVGIYVMKDGASVYVHDCYIAGASYQILADKGGYADVRGSVIDGGVIGIYALAQGFLQLDASDSTGRSRVSSCSSTGVQAEANVAVSLGGMVIEGCRDGFLTGGGTHVNTTTSTGCKILGSTRYGLYVGAGASNSGVELRDGVIDGSTSDGVHVAVTQHHVDLAGTAITNNGGFGVNMGPTNSCNHNNVEISAATTMSGNASGDFTVDGTTPISVATLRAIPDKTVSDHAWGGIEVHDGSTPQVLATAGVFEKIVALVAERDGVLTTASTPDHRLTVDIPGVYNVCFSMSASATSTNSFKGKIRVNGEDVIHIAEFDIYVNPNNVANASISTGAGLSKGDYIELWMAPGADSTSITITHACMGVHLIRPNVPMSNMISEA